MVAASRERALPLLAVPALLLDVALATAALLAGAGLEGVAVAALVSQGAHAAVLLAQVGRAARIPRLAVRVATLFVPLVWCVSAVVALGLLFPGHDPASVGAAVAVYAVLVAPLAWRSARAPRRASLALGSEPRR
jgi:hypothetical protein